jgi:hypothetical protein
MGGIPFFAKFTNKTGKDWFREVTFRALKPIEIACFRFFPARQFE